VTSRICLIDDDIYVRDAMALGLSDLGFEVLTAPGAAAGFDLVQREGVDAIVTDIHMPGSDGTQLIQQARERWPTLPIVAITGSTDFGADSVEAVAKRLGADEVMRKPFRAGELAQTLRRLLQKSES
jgi:DNA-binding response OmpR family regulator